MRIREGEPPHQARHFLACPCSHLHWRDRKAIDDVSRASSATTRDVFLLHAKAPDEGRESLRGSRVQPEDLHARIAAGERVQVADLRQRMEFNAFPRTIPTAIRVPLDVFDEEVEKLSRERPLVLFCT